ncbi:hypothetical protein ACFL38_02270 [Candidatus Omnitrophota bacterium]
MKNALNFTRLHLLFLIPIAGVLLSLSRKNLENLWEMIERQHWRKDSFAWWFAWLGVTDSESFVRVSQKIRPIVLFFLLIYIIFLLGMLV